MKRQRSESNRAHDVTGFILAGGESSRMGQDKAFLKFEGHTLLSRALDLAGKVCDQVRIVGSSEKFAAFGTVVEDSFSSRGPLGGIHAALKSSSTDLNLLLAVDMPFLNPEFLRYLLGQARATAAFATVPRCTGGWQPLCAVYRRDFADAAEGSLHAGRNKIDPLFAHVPIHVIEEAELLRLGFNPEIFRNLNTPEEFSQAQSKAR
jgi:molybdopterin-guanine dinucleotide biosynthesis protein A